MGENAQSGVRFEGVAWVFRRGFALDESVLSNRPRSLFRPRHAKQLFSIGLHRTSRVVTSFKTQDDDNDDEEATGATIPTVAGGDENLIFRVGPSLLRDRR